MKKEKMKFSESVFYALGASTGKQFITGVIATYILVYLTDTFGVPAGAAGVIMFIATVWDAINDPIMGTLADRTKSKWGKYRPYLFFVPIPLSIVSVLLFAGPDLSVTGRIIYTAVLYICFGMLVTAIEIPYGALLPTMTKDSDERTRTVQASTFVSSIVILITTSFTTNLVDVLGGGDVSRGYMILISIGAVCMVVTSWLAFAKCKERYNEEKKQEPLLVELKKLSKQKSLFTVLIIWCMGFLSFQIVMASSVYYCMYYLCRPDLIATYMLTISIGGMVGIMGLVPVFMKIYKGDVKKCFVTSQLCAAVCYLILFFVGGKNQAVLYTLTFIGAMFATMINAYIQLLGVEMTDYLSYKTGEQLNATVAALRGFATKCGTALSNAILGGMLAWTGYKAGAIGQQTDMALLGINASRFLIPAIAIVILVVCFRFYPVTDKFKREYYSDNSVQEVGAEN